MGDIKTKKWLYLNLIILLMLIAGIVIPILILKSHIEIAENVEMAVIEKICSPLIIFSGIGILCEVLWLTGLTFNSNIFSLNRKKKVKE